MASKPFKPCKHPGCTNLSRTSYCNDHAAKQPSQRGYDLYTRDKDSKRFYNSAAWIKCKRFVLLRDNYLCQGCLKHGSLTPAQDVHHIKELKSHRQFALDSDNLISLCDSCHNKARGK